ncbi:hypothetical protein [Kitasatospora sp. NPDC087314]|uniref:hypothetical protein n=1 Tax=Kitasatospora sp. NPDC087314 TaxID=3364068 RepID=UPI0038070F09
MTTPPTADHPAGADSPTPGRRPRKPQAAHVDQYAAHLLRKLTPREAEALAHLAAGRDLPQTAAALGVTPAAASGYIQRAVRKLGAATEAEAVALTTPPQTPDTAPSTASAASAASATGDATTQRPPVLGAGAGQPARPTPATPGGHVATPPDTRGNPPPAGDRPDAPLTGTGRHDRAVPAAGTFEELYEQAHARLVQQVFLLTACRHRAVHCVRLAFGAARRGWGRVSGTGDPEGWVRARACELALSPWHRGGPRRAHAWKLPHRRIKVRPADESQAVLPDHDRLTDRDRALLTALRRLTRPQRRALVLHDGLGLPAAAVAVEVESTRTAAEGRVWTARTALAQWAPDLVGPDPAAPGFADGLSALLHQAAVRGCPEPHRPPVPALQARHRLWTASRTGAAALLTVAVGGAALATLVGIPPETLFRPPEPPEPAVCRPEPNPDNPGVPVLRGGPPIGVRSLWCSPTPGVEAVMVEAQPRAAGRWELPAATLGPAAPPPPQGPEACPMWSPLPCTTGSPPH